jgi:hypothetical protein
MVRWLPRAALILILVTAFGCSSGHKSDPTDLGNAEAILDVFKLCIISGPGVNEAGGTCDDGIQETSRFVSHLDGLDLTKKDRDRLITRAIHAADAYCTECVDLLDVERRG